MLSKGAFARFYGGPNVIRRLNDKGGSLVWWVKIFDNLRLQQSTDIKTFPLQSYLREPVFAVSTVFHCVQAFQNEKDKQPKHCHKIR